MRFALTSVRILRSSGGSETRVPAAPATWRLLPPVIAFFLLGRGRGTWQMAPRAGVLACDKPVAGCQLRWWQRLLSVPVWSGKGIGEERGSHWRTRACGGLASAQKEALLCWGHPGPLRMLLF